jgi:hypothetical protein
VQHGWRIVWYHPAGKANLAKTRKFRYQTRRGEENGTRYSVQLKKGKIKIKIKIQTLSGAKPPSRSNT